MTLTTQRPLGFRLSYRATVRRLIGTPSAIESTRYPKGWTPAQQLEMDGFRQACEDFGFVVVNVDDVDGSRMLRAWGPRLHAWWIAPDEEQLRRADRFIENCQELGYRIEVETTTLADDVARLDIRAWRTPTSENLPEVPR